MLISLQVDFFRPNDNSLVSNIISDDPTGGSNIHMTYCFILTFPNISESDTAEIERMTKGQKNMSQMAVEKSIETIREMVKSGKI